MPLFRKSHTPTTSKDQILVDQDWSSSPSTPVRKLRNGEKTARPRSVFNHQPIVLERDSSLYRHEDNILDLPKGYIIEIPKKATGSSSPPPPLFRENVDNTITTTLTIPAITFIDHSNTYLSPSQASSVTSCSRSSSTSRNLSSRPSTWCQTPADSEDGSEGYDLDQLQQQPFVVKSRPVISKNDSDLERAKKEQKIKWGGLASLSSFDLRLPTKAERKSKFRGIGMNSEIWTKSTTPSDNENPSTMTSSVEAKLPTVPPRSRLRPSASPPRPTERNSSLYLLPVDLPLDRKASNNTPSLSSGSSSDQEDLDSGRPVVKKEKDVEFVLGRKKRVNSAVGLSAGGDPLRVRDGAMSRKASSGLYTPPTFPGPEGPRPSHFPTHVYTPQNFTLHPTAPRPTLNNYHTVPGVPTRSLSESSTGSSSTSSSNYQEPLTPPTPSSTQSRFGKTFTSIKRISNQITSPIISTPKSPVDDKFHINTSYFPPQFGYSTTTSRSNHTSWSSTNTSSSFVPPTTTARQFGYQSMTPGAGLGVGPLEEGDEGCVTRVIFDEDGRVKGTVVKVPENVLTSPVQKGRRKPVPKILDLESDGQDDGIPHAL